jgi:hypothetical protein
LGAGNAEPRSTRTPVWTGSDPIVRGQPSLLAVVMLAVDLIVWTQYLLMKVISHGPSPKTLRYRCGTALPRWMKLLADGAP